MKSRIALLLTDLPRRARDDRGDVPGWVLVAVCGVIAALVSLAQPRSFEVAS